MKANPERLRGETGPQHQGAIDLARKEATRLAMPLPCIERLERLVPIENQLRTAVGDHALRRRALAIVFQKPKTVDERPKLPGRLDFAIPNHLGRIAGSPPTI